MPSSDVPVWQDSFDIHEYEYNSQSLSVSFTQRSRAEPVNRFYLPSIWSQFMFFSTHDRRLPRRDSPTKCAFREHILHLMCSSGRRKSASRWSLMSSTSEPRRGTK